MRLSVFDAAREEPSRVAVISGDQSLTFAELASRVEQRLGELHAASALDSSGIRPVAVVARPTLASVETLLALFAAGTPALLLHARSTEPERAALIARAGAVPEPGHDRSGPSPTLTDFDPERIVAILPTSGSTGEPRLAELSHRALIASVGASSANLGIEEDRALLALPLAHVGGLCVLARALGNRRAVVLFEPERSLLGELDRFVDCAERHAVTVISLVPTVLERLLSPPISWRPPASLRAVLLGGSAIPRALVAKARATGVPVMPTYGMTETCAQLTTCRYSDRLSAVDDGGDIFPSGVPLPGAEVRIVDGCVEVRAPTLFSGYLGDETRHTPEVWLATRDRGFVAENGELVITGRASDLIITGGENVDPVEVEAAVAALPGVKQCFVYGVPDGVFGEIVSALVVAGPGAPTTAEGLAERLSGRLASFKLPRRLALVEALPLTPSGKIDRRAARALRPFAG